MKLLGYCDSCGIAVYENDEALTVKVNGDIIHKACWDYYAEEHIDLFTETEKGKSEEDL